MLLGFFSPWVSVSQSYSGETVSAEVSGWNTTQGEVEVTARGSSNTIKTGEGLKYPYLTLIGGILILVGSVDLLRNPDKKRYAAVIGVGAIIAIISASWAFLDIQSDMSSNLSLYSNLQYEYG